MRRLIVSLAAAAVLVMAVAAIGVASPGPKLSGTFKVTLTFGRASLGIPPGTMQKDVYKFTSACQLGHHPTGCNAVFMLDRDGGKHQHYKTTLHRKSSGVYEGTEGPYPYPCPDGSKATFKGDHIIRVTASKKGVASKIGGSLQIRVTGACDLVFDYSIVGTR